MLIRRSRPRRTARAKDLRLGCDERTTFVRACLLLLALSHLAAMLDRAAVIQVLNNLLVLFYS